VDNAPFFFTNTLLCFANSKTTLLSSEIREICDDLQSVDNQRFGKVILSSPFLSLAIRYQWQYDEGLNAWRVKLFHTTIKAQTHHDKIVNATASIFSRFPSRKYRLKHGAFLSGCSENKQPKNGNHILH
jgi:hypothetical protein